MTADNLLHLPIGKRIANSGLRDMNRMADDFLPLPAEDLTTADQDQCPPDLRDIPDSQCRLDLMFLRDSRCQKKQRISLWEQWCFAEDMKPIRVMAVVQWS